nr:unnamed protein product [Callosobruchus analis]
MEDIRDENRAREQKRIKELRAIIEEKREFGDVALVLQEEWPEGRFKVTKKGDLNAKSRKCGSQVEDRRGIYLAERMSELDMVANNNATAPTFSIGSNESYIDATLSTQRVARSTINWEVKVNENLSDHKHIYFEISGEGPRQDIEKKSSSL